MKPELSAYFKRTQSSKGITKSRFGRLATHSTSEAHHQLVGLHYRRKRRNVRLFFLLRRAPEEELKAQVLVGELEIHHVAHGDEGEGDDDQQAKSFRVGCQDDHDEVQQVEEVVHGVLHPVDDSPFGLDHIFLDQLGHS